jgi:hypothetical protein
MNDTQNNVATKDPVATFEWQTLDTAVRGWIVMSLFQKDQDDYEKLRLELS